MALSVHDNFLVPYEVQCESRIITLRTEYRDAGPAEYTNIVFSGVEGYHFQGDAFGNIIFDVAEIQIEQFLKEFSSEISELYRFNAKPDWAAVLDSAPAQMRARGIKPYVLSSSYGSGGWVLAKEISRVPAG